MILTLCLKNNIKAEETVDDDGKYTNNVPLFEGVHIFKANKIIIEKLKEQKKLLASGELVHQYPHSWRSKAPLVHRATPQWFISMESHGLRKKALKAIDETKFYPRKGKERLKSMIEQDQTGVFQGKEFGEFRFQCLYQKKQMKFCLTKKLLKILQKFLKKKVLIVGSRATLKGF